MRIVLMALTGVALAGCSQQQSPGSDRRFGASNNANAPVRVQADTDDTASSPAAMVAPGISVTAAPGVAFSYEYAFRLPAAKIAAAQEVHAQACEKLGVGRCRITGMRYRVSGENAIEGMLSFKLDPALARDFGKRGIDAVATAGGALVDAEITGTDAGAAITQAQTDKARAEDELKRIDRELARTDLKTDERIQLQSQRSDLVNQVAGAKNTTSEQEQALANTPMTFAYESGPAVRGFDASAPVTSSINTLMGSAQITLAVVLGILALFGPPAILLALLWLAWRSLRRRRTGSAQSMAAPPAD
jgi:hypothetical protein